MGLTPKEGVLKQLKEVRRSLRVVTAQVFAVKEAPTSIRCPRDVFEYMQPYAAREVQENFWILVLDAQHQLIGHPVVVTVGLVNSSLVHPREVFRAVILMGGSALIAVHNHPSGDPTPSADDRIVTEQLVQAGRTLDLPMQDHLIVTAEKYLSFAESGLL